mgnify:FL=1|tara:strand:+ start:54 stop:263 length:210 start_codon:yes stop_codon:yes gene_type:complete
MTGRKMKLHEQVVVHKAINEVAVEGIADIKRYLNLSKFSEDIRVNKNDILLRLNELEDSLFLESIKLKG